MQIWAQRTQGFVRLAWRGVLIVFATMGGAGAGEGVTVATTPFPPYVVKEAEGRVSGPAVAVVRRVCELAEVDCDIRAYPWARAFVTAKSVPNTLIFSIARRAEREELFRWIGTVSPYHVKLFTKKGGSVPAAGRWRDLRSYTLAGQRKDVKAQFLNKNGFKVSWVTTAESTIKMLYADRVDLVAGDALSLPYRVRQLGLDIDDLAIAADVPDLSSELYLAANADTDEHFIERLGHSLQKIKDSGEFEGIWRDAGLTGQ